MTTLARRALLVAALLALAAHVNAESWDDIVERYKTSRGTPEASRVAAANSVTVIVGGQSFEVTTIEGSFVNIRDVVMSQPWWSADGDGALAQQFAEAVGAALGYPNAGGFFGPLFGYYLASPGTVFGFAQLVFIQLGSGTLPMYEVVTWAILVPHVNGDPHFQAFSGQKYDVCMGDKHTTCQGNVFNLLSEERHQINVELDRLAGLNAWPAAGTWITGFGFRYRSATTGAEYRIELRMRKDQVYELVKDNRTPDSTRAVPVDGKSFKRLLAAVLVDGQDVLARVESGDSLTVAGGEVLVHFPASKHTNDAQGTDGPVMIVKTPDMRFTVFLESEDTWHLDFSTAVLGGNSIKRMHGLLGQTYHWNKDTPIGLEGGDELAYIVSDGLLGTANKFALYGTKPAPRVASSRMLLRALFAASVGHEKIAVIAGSKLE